MFRKNHISQQYGRQNSKWPRRVTNLQNSCYNSRIIEHILTFNSLFERYFDWAENQVRENFIFQTNMAAKIQNGRKSKKNSSEKLLLFKNYGIDFNVQ